MNVRGLEISPSCQAPNANRVPAGPLLGVVNVMLQTTFWVQLSVAGVLYAPGAQPAPSTVKIMPAGLDVMVTGTAAARKHAVRKVRTIRMGLSDRIILTPVSGGMHL